MLRKMYLVSPDYLNTVTSNDSNTPPPPPPGTVRKVTEAGEKHKSSKRWSVQTKKLKKKKKDTARREHDRWVTKRSAARREYDKWFKVRVKLHEADVERMRQIKTVADLLKQVLPAFPPPPRRVIVSFWYADRTWSHKRYIKSEPPPPATPAKRRIACKTAPISSTSSDVLYETSTPPPTPSIKRDVDDDEDVSAHDQRVEPDVLECGARTLGELASPYVSPYLYESKWRGLDTEYGMRRVGDGFMIGDSRVGMDRDGNIHIKNVEFPATKGLWELLTRKKVNKKSVTTDDLKQYKTILEMNNAHLEGYEPEGNIRTFRGLKFRDVISRLFAGSRKSGVETALRREWVTY